MLINHTYFGANRAARNSPQVIGCYPTQNPSTERWRICALLSYIMFVSCLSRYWRTAAGAVLTGLATETDCGSNCRTCRLPCTAERRPTWDQKEDRLETDGCNSSTVPETAGTIYSNVKLAWRWKIVLQKKKQKIQNCTRENRKCQLFGCRSWIVAIVGVHRWRACAFVGGCACTAFTTSPTGRGIFGDNLI